MAQQLNKEQKIITLLQATGLFNIIAKLEYHKGVILAYDQDQDPRLKAAVDHIKKHKIQQDLMVAYECDGCLTLIWKAQVPKLFAQGNSVPVCYPDEQDNIDHWHITHSVTSRAIEQQALLKLMRRPTNFGFSLN